jgi:hypothetical protein
MKRRMIKKNGWRGVEIYIETNHNNSNEWTKTLNAAKNDNGPWPLPLGHMAFNNPKEYNAELI